MNKIQKICNEIYEYMQTDDYMIYRKANNDGWREINYSGPDDKEQIIEYIRNNLFKTVDYYYLSQIGRYRRTIIDGYIGAEGGGEHVSYVFTITNIDTDEVLGTFVAVGGYYSYDGAVIYNILEVASETTETVTMTKKTYLDADGKEIYSHF